MYVYIYIYILAINAIGGEPSKYARLKPYQKSLLEAAFANNSYLTETTLMHLAKQTGLGHRRIRVWFSNRRSFIRKGRKEGTISSSE